MQFIEHSVKTKFVIDDKGNCYSVERELEGAEGKSALVIMYSSVVDDVKITDNTAHLLWNNMLSLGYSKVVIWNLYPSQDKRNEEVQNENLKMLEQLIETELDAVVVAWGVSKGSAKYVLEDKIKVFNVISKVKDKLMQIEDVKGRYVGNTFHPLFAGNYFGNCWKLVKYTIPETKKEGGEKGENNIRRNRSKTATEEGLNRFKDKLKNGGSDTGSK